MNLKFLWDAGMSKIGLKLRICLLGLLIMAIISGCGTGDSIKTNDTTKKESITSSIIGDSYPLYISLPKDYDSNPGTYYSVVYLLDGDGYFNETQRMIYDHVGHNDMNPVILVGIGNSEERYRDYSPTANSEYPEGGGSEKFCNFLKTELIPYIDGRYRTITNADGRCLVGHSISGICAYYALFFYNDTFHKFLAASPSLWWDGEIIFKYEADYAASHASLPVVLYSSSATGDYTIPVDLEAMLDRLNKYSGINIFSDTFEGQLHVNSWRPAFDKGLPLLF
jgi:predicted alpha/beta superfamily hydrolase